MQDMLGMNSDFTPKFVKKFAAMGDESKQAYTEYIQDVKSGAFPEMKHSFAIDDETIDKLI
jgi:3-methyl-2-oxobutanoate hydroxymethyltransferase